MPTPREIYAGQHGETAAQKIDQMLYQDLAAAAAAAIRQTLHQDGMEKVIGFTVIMFEFGPPGGALGYASTANREDMLRVLDEMRAKLAQSLDAPPGRD